MGVTAKDSTELQAQAREWVARLTSEGRSGWEIRALASRLAEEVTRLYVDPCDD